VIVQSNNNEVQTNLTSFRSKCASCVGGIGILLCSILMSLSVIGTTAISLSKNANIDNSMGNMVACPV